MGEITDADLKDRRILGEEGFISVIVVVDAATGRIITGPEIHARGFAEDDKVFDDVKPKIAAALTEAAPPGVRDTHALSQVVRRTIGRWVNQRLRRRPMIVPSSSKPERSRRSATIGLDARQLSCAPRDTGRWGVPGRHGRRSGELAVETRARGTRC